MTYSKVTIGDNHFDLWTATRFLLSKQGNLPLSEVILIKVIFKPGTDANDSGAELVGTSFPPIIYLNERAGSWGKPWQCKYGILKICVCHICLPVSLKCSCELGRYPSYTNIDYIHWSLIIWDIVPCWTTFFCDTLMYTSIHAMLPRPITKNSRYVQSNSRWTSTLLRAILLNLLVKFCKVQRKCTKQVDGSHHLFEHMLVKLDHHPPGRLHNSTKK